MFLNLQLLRAFAALNVVLFHTIGTSSAYGYETNLISSLEGWGENGLDIFFVISGFVMLFTQLENKRSVKDFLILRAIRIIPIYWLLTLLVIVIHIVAPFVFREMIISVKWALASLGFLSNAIGERYPIIVVGWTLEWEMLFYLVFGLCLSFRSWITTLSVTSIVLLGVAFFVSNFILVEFIAGLLIALAYKLYGFKRFGVFSLILGFILLSLSLLDSVKLLTDNRVILWGFPSIFIVYGVVAAPQINSKIGKLLGDASYSIYLIQTLSLPFFYKLLTVLNIQMNNDLLVLACLVTTAIGGVAMHLLVEKPMIGLLKKRIYAD
tara:strand:- start:1015 stop:1983 length:969 start_codon:yes stop_codon:yes gene_type:complete